MHEWKNYVPDEGRMKQPKRGPGRDEHCKKPAADAATGCETALDNDAAPLQQKVSHG